MSVERQYLYCLEPAMYVFDDGTTMYGDCNEPCLPDVQTCKKHTPDKEMMDRMNEQCHHGLSE